MLAQLADAERHLSVSRRMFTELPRNQLSEIPAAKDNLRSIDQNLKSIADQRKFWVEEQVDATLSGTPALGL